MENRLDLIKVVKKVEKKEIFKKPVLSFKKSSKKEKQYPKLQMSLKIQKKILLV